MEKSLVQRHSFLAQVKEEISEGSTALARRCAKVGITTGNVEEVIDICTYYSHPVTSVVRRMEDGMSLPRINQCLEISALMDDMPNLSVRAINSLLDRVGFEVEDPAPILETFQDAIANRYRGRRIFPMQWFLHRIDEVFGGDILEAYHMAIEDPDEFGRMITSRPEDLLRR